jgi:hypothetical protein
LAFSSQHSVMRCSGDYEQKEIDRGKKTANRKRRSKKATSKTTG